jgi:hypothetical protein
MSGTMSTTYHGLGGKEQEGKPRVSPVGLNTWIVRYMNYEVLEINSGNCRVEFRTCFTI